MTTLTLEPVATHTGGDETDHLFCCCSPNVAICGAAIPPDEPICPDDCTHEQCTRCSELMDDPCLFCGLTRFDDACACGGCVL